MNRLYSVCLLAAVLMLMLPRSVTADEVRFQASGRPGAPISDAIRGYAWGAYYGTVHILDSCTFVGQDRKRMSRSRFYDEFKGGSLRVIYTSKDGYEYRAIEIHWLP